MPEPKTSICIVCGASFVPEWTGITMCNPCIDKKIKPIENSYNQDKLKEYQNQINKKEIIKHGNKRV